MKKEYRYDQEDMDLEIRNDRIRKMIVKDPSMILILKEEFVSDDLWIFTFHVEPSMFRHIRHPSLRVCYAALDADGMNLKYVRRAGYEITPRMALIAVRSTPGAIRYVPKDIRTDSLKEIAFDADPSLMANYHNIRKEYVDQKIKENPAIIQYVKNATDEQKIAALKLLPAVCVYFNHPSPELKLAMQTYAPEYYGLMYKSEANITSD